MIGIYVRTVTDYETDNVDYISMIVFYRDYNYYTELYNEEIHDIEKDHNTALKIAKNTQRLLTFVGVDVLIEDSVEDAIAS